MSRIRSIWIALTWVLAAAALICSACEEPEEPPSPGEPLTVSSEDLNVTEIPNQAVTGTIRGREFAAQDACVHTIEVPGQEQVDIVLAESKIAFCGVPGQPIGDRSSRVWIRARGIKQFEKGVLRIDPDDEHVSAHYEVFEGEQWRGAAAKATLLVVDSSGQGALIGRLHVCFDDGFASCVKGKVLARPCHSSIDIDMLGERFSKIDVEER